ncbi:MAG TPA: helix-turn-helix domain-containing protein [Blastocatellia bacterium]|nr:helix-turn-helix domain-containing protein [Blastocatellia bacterium]
MSPSERGFNARDRQRLSKALAAAVEVRIFRRIQAVLLVAEGRTLVEAAHITGLSLQSVYNQLDRYWQAHRVESLFDLPHSGRPPDAPALTERQILRELQRSPLKLGYRTNVWTVETLAQRLKERYDHEIAPWTLRRRMKELNLVCKRPRYFYAEKDPHRAQKKGRLSAS